MPLETRLSQLQTKEKAAKCASLNKALAIIRPSAQGARDHYTENVYVHYNNDGYGAQTQELTDVCRKE